MQIPAIIIGLCLAGVFISLWRTIGSPTKNSDERKEVINNKLISIGAELVSIEKMKKSLCPYSDELGLAPDAVYVPYKVDYFQDGKSKIGWAILIIRGTMLMNSVVGENIWIYKFEDSI